MSARIVDQHGRIGVVTEDRGDMVFARPEAVDYVISDRHGVTGAQGAQLITSTAWSRHPDGTLSGLWYDSPLHANLAARLA